jgi:hypothetical protein
MDSLADACGRGVKNALPPEVEIQAACPWSVSAQLCELQSFFPWDGQELARQLIPEGIIENIADSTVRQIPVAHQLRPGRHRNQRQWLLCN